MLCWNKNVPGFREFNQCDRIFLNGDYYRIYPAAAIQAAHGVMKTELLFLVKVSRDGVTSANKARTHAQRGYQPPSAQARLGSWLDDQMKGVGPILRLRNGNLC